MGSNWEDSMRSLLRGLLCEEKFEAVLKCARRCDDLEELVYYVDGFRVLLNRLSPPEKLSSRFTL
jgi:hypothetical protein